MAVDMTRTCPSPTLVERLASPLDFIHEGHLRGRGVCATLEGVAAGSDPGDVALAIRFLTDELPLHLEDVEEDLFPLLKRRCEREDEIEQTIEKLVRAHSRFDDETSRVIAVLEAVEKGKGPSGDQRSSLAAYTVDIRSALVLEHAITLPFARRRLTKDDLQTLRLRMMARRGVNDIGGHRC